MSYSTALQDLQDYNDTMNLLQTSDENTDVDNKKSIRKLVKETVGKTGVSWSASEKYIVGDIISENSKEYICSANNINKLPSTNPNEWTKYEATIVAGARGFNSKLVFTKYGDILNGEKYFTISSIGNGAFRCTFIEELPSDLYAVFYSVDSETLEKFSLTILDKQSTHFDIRTYSYTDNTFKDADRYNILILRG